MTTDLSLRIITSPASVTPPVISTTRLSWATSLFYFGMLAGLYPLTYLFQRLSLGRVLGAVVVAWGGIAMLTAAVRGHRGLFAQRFFLGFTESIMPTAFMVVVSGYYTQAEQTMRQSWWYSATGGWTVIGAALNYAFAHITAGALARWQYLYLLAGAITVLFGLCCFWLPNSPASAWWFDGEEKVVAIERLRMGQMGVRCQKLKWGQIREAVLDPKCWLLGVMMGAAYTVNGAVTGFGPLIVSTFGYTAFEALLWQMPLGAVCFVSILLTGYLSLKVPNIRLIMLITCCLPVIAGCAMIWKSTWSHHAATPIAGYTVIGFFAPVTSLTVSTGMANVAGATKKSYMAANIFVFYCVGNIVGPQLVKSQTLQRHYPELWLGIIISYCLVIVLAITLMFILRRENMRRERMQLDEKEAEKTAFEDLTDKENPHFRYVY
ncbi:hypothetical protein GJ744_002022 [Endocarpon pusillum]|uniref:Major facilitator superfamily (MFS) profile domain-containing protein n=1 Tax=Endocarpon pusillum TaxID=364733 RepID=A0A8H7A9I9_9EURO|nr:hypothetical protein GJ744_002022 [Endocarpon pusillum]